jgi:hypothetical protein
LFEAAVKKVPDQAFLGSRFPEGADNVYGPYRWQTYRQIYEKVNFLAKSMQSLDLCPEVTAEEGG